MNLKSLRIGFFLAVRYVKGASIWTTLLIIFIMLLTFLNVIVVRGILVGLPEGARIAYEEQYAGSVIITPASERSEIEQTPYVLNVLQNVEGYQRHSTRYTEGGLLEANYKENRPSRDLPDSVGVEVIGVDVAAEDALTGLSEMVIEGEYLDSRDASGVLLGHQLLERYAVVGSSENSTIREVFPGDTVRLTINDARREYTVRGIVKSKVGANSRRVIIVESEARRMMDRFDRSANEIAVQVGGGSSADKYKNVLLAAGLGEYATIQTAEESQGQFLQDIKSTFEVLSNVIGLIGIAVATITVFIVIFIFAITRQKQIGILKGIGISRTAIKSSFVFLSVFYACIGIILGALLLYLVIEPYILEHPIDFPFSDGLLVALYTDTLIRSLVIIGATILAGYIPARMIVKKNTINSILGR